MPLILRRKRRGVSFVYIPYHSDRRFFSWVTGAIYHWYAAKQEPGILHGCWCASSGTNLDNFGEGPPVVSSVFRERGGGAQGELKREKYDLAMEDAYTQQTLFPKRFYKKKFYIHM